MRDPGRQGTADGVGRHPVGMGYDDEQTVERGTLNGAARGRRLGRRLVLAVVTAVGVVLCLLIAGSFVPALTWSVALAVSLHRPYGWIERRIGKPAVAAVVGTVLVLLVVVVLLLWPLRRMAVCECCSKRERRRGVWWVCQRRRCWCSLRRVCVHCVVLRGWQ